MKRKRIIMLSLFLFIFLLLSYFLGLFYRRPPKLELGEPKSNYGLVPDEATAIKIAEIIGLKSFGNELRKYKPFQAKLENDSIWRVYGIPPKSRFFVQLGGAPVFEIQKSDCKILRVYLSR